MDIGSHLREWRQRRRLSQLDLAVSAEISTRHLSFIETGRSQPSRDMVLRLAEQLEVPLRARNALLVAAGFAPVFSERPLDDPALGSARAAMQQVLRGHEPYPALAVDRHWTMLAANAAVGRLVSGVAPHLLAPPVNVLRLSLHPEGLAPRIANLAEWRTHLLVRLRRQIDVSADPVLESLMQELAALPAPKSPRPARPVGPEAAVVVPLQLHSDAGLLMLISTTTVFGTPLDITVAEIALETFFPADTSTAEKLRQLAGP
ncbi:MAG: helix-turn-helix transcriptional regulator [Pseudolabrys sp.]|nr:helix-turn-helix transcriptional regulator [Pseudolabrys sp.]